MITPNLPSASAPVTRVERAHSPPPEAHVNPLLKLHLMLYGRYKWAITLGVILGICGAAAVWVSMPPKYEVIGYVRIKPYIPPLITLTPETGMLPMFETFVSLQVSLLQSQRVVNQASLNLEWKALGRNSPRWGSKIPSDALTIDHPKNSEIITVAFADRDANVATIAVKTILVAYEAISKEADGINDPQQLPVLEDQKTTLTNQKRGLGEQILAIGIKYGTDQLHDRYLFKLDQQNRLETELQQLDLDISFAKAAAGSAAATQRSATQPGSATQPSQVVLTREDVARVDLQMRDLLAQESRAQLQLKHLRARLGEKHPEVLAATDDLQAIEDQITALLAIYQARGMEAAGLGPMQGIGSGKLPLAELIAQEASIRAKFDQVVADTKELGQDDLKIRNLKEDQDAVSKRLDEISTRIDQLTLESKMSNRISVMNYGEEPTAPMPSKRLPMTAGVGLLGLAVGVGLVALRGLADRRVTSLLHMQQLAPAIRVLGMLPVLPDDFADPSQIALTAHCVHQIRNLLDAAPVQDKGRVLAITSPSAGDGKTSLTLALGLSFAVSGSRTLLIDCDMVGGGLTSRLNAIARRRLGSILEKKGLLSAQQVHEALRVAGETHKKFGETVADLGYLTPEEVQQALADQHETSVGLLDALNGEPLASCIVSIVTENLSILPLGDAAPENTNQMSAKALRRIIKEARSQFELIIVDTGPILGSIEASVVAREADEVVLAVTRGSSSPLVTKTVELLASLGARLGGIVFNRATPGDVAYSKYGSSGSSRSFQSSQSQRPQSSRRSPAGTPPRLGPVAAAVAAAGSQDSVPHVNGAVKKSAAANGHENGNSNGKSSSLPPARTARDTAAQEPKDS